MLRLIRSPIGLAVAQVILLSTPVEAREQEDPFEPAREFIRETLKTTTTPSVTVAVAADGEILWQEGFGWADRENRVAAGPFVSYSLASISKPITATGLMTLVAAGKIDLNRPANDYLGDAQLRTDVSDVRAATVRRLANHSSGLPLHYQYFFVPDSPPPMDLTILRYGHLIAAPGERYMYSNLGTGLLGYIISRVSGESFAAYMRQNVFVPLGMTNSFVNDGTSRRGTVAVRYDATNARLPNYRSDTPGAADIYASAHDLLRFGMMHLKNRLPNQDQILPDALIDEMHRADTRVSDARDHGLGWHIRRRPDGHRVVYHGGGLAGVSTTLMLVPDRDIAVVVLINRFSRSPRVLVTEISDRIMQVLLPDWQSGVDDPEPEPARFLPQRELIGRWSGSIHTVKGDLPLSLEVLPSGDIHAQLADQPITLLSDLSEESGWITGTMGGDIGTADAAENRPNRLTVEFKQRGNEVYGVVTVGSDYERPHIDGMAMTLSHPVRLEREQAEAHGDFLL